MQADEVGKEAELTAPDCDPRVCPECEYKSGIVESWIEAGGHLARRRECLRCGERWTTIEVKRGLRRQPLEINSHEFRVGELVDLDLGLKEDPIPAVVVCLHRGWMCVDLKVLDNDYLEGKGCDGLYKIPFTDQEGVVYDYGVRPHDESQPIWKDLRVVRTKSARIRSKSQRKPA